MLIGQCLLLNTVMLLLSCYAFAAAGNCIEVMTTATAPDGDRESGLGEAT